MQQLIILRSIGRTITRMKFENICWKAYFKINSESKIKLMIKKLEKVIEKPITVISSQKYWKDNSLYEVSFTTPLGIDEVEKAIFEVLRTYKLLGQDCHIVGPEINAGKKWSFEGICSRTNISGLEWISFNIQNYVDL